MTTSSNPTPRERGLSAAVYIQLRADPAQWRSRVDAIEDPEVRAVAEQYLRDILARMRARRDLKLARQTAPQARAR